MALVFTRHPSWSRSQAIARIDGRLQSVAKRREDILVEIASLNAEEVELAAFAAQLGTLRAVEVSKVPPETPNLGSNIGAPPPVSDAVSDGTESADSAASSIIERSAGEAASATRYDADRKLFLGPGGFNGGSTEPRRIEVEPGSELDPLMARALKMIETPGLLHAMVLAERKQEIIDVDAVSVPEEAMGLPQAEAYRGHVFSADAFHELSDPARSEAYLKKLRATE